MKAEEKILKLAIATTMQAVSDYLASDHVRVISDMDGSDITEQCTITSRNIKIDDYVFGALKKIGITITFNT